MRPVAVRELREDDSQEHRYLRQSGRRQLMLDEKKGVDPAVLNTKLATVLDRITELEEMQNKLLKQNYREAHRNARSDFWDATENQLQNWCKTVKDFTIYYETMMD